MPLLELSPGGRRYGYHRDSPDSRDFLFSRMAGIEVPAGAFASASNIEFLGPVLDQGQEGSCTAHSAAADREFLHWKELAGRGTTPTPGAEGLYSPSFIYYLERKEDSSLDQGDCGSTGRTSCATLRKYGCALRSDMPYTAGDFSTAPTDAQLAAAAVWATGGYHRLNGLDDMKACIASGYCFRIGFAVYESFESIGGDGIWTPDKTTEQVLDGHEVLAFGFDDSVNGGSLHVRNSWGAGWGQAGNFWMRYQDAVDPDIFYDGWIQHLGIWKPAPAA